MNGRARRTCHILSYIRITKHDQPSTLRIGKIIGSCKNMIVFYVLYKQLAFKSVNFISNISLCLDNVRRKANGAATSNESNLLQHIGKLTITAVRFYDTPTVQRCDDTVHSYAPLYDSAHYKFKDVTILYRVTYRCMIVPTISSKM